MKILSGTRRSHPVRALVVGLAALVAGGMVSLGMTAPAFADAPINFTVKLTNKAGVALTSYDVYPIEETAGSQTPGTISEPASPVNGQPGEYSMQLVSGADYTLEFSPTGASANSGTIQFLGGSAFFAGSTDFTPSASFNFLAASIATGSTITGKVIGPTGAALKNAEVDAYQFDGTNWTTSIYTTTSSTGAFTFVNAVPGSYRFEFYAPGGVYPPIYSGSAATLDAAATTFVQVGTTATVNQKMTVGTGSITGTALASDSTDGTAGDGDLFYDSGRVPVAIPVTAENISGQATTLDVDRSVAGAEANSKGAWAIHNLPAGNYVVETEINFYGEGTEYLSHQPFPTPGTPAPTLAEATVFTVTAGHTISTGTSVFPINFSDDGADPRYTIEDSSNAPIIGANVIVAPVNDPFDFVHGTSDSGGDVTLYDSDDNQIFDDNDGDDSDNPLTTGYYTVTVTNPGTPANPTMHEPYTATVYLGFGTVDSVINLPDLIAQPGITDPVIGNTDETAVGTQYTASATATREDATVSYQWMRDGQPIFGATDASYTSTGADLNTQLSVQATASSFGFYPVTSNAVSVAGGVTTAGDAPAIDPDNEPSISPSTGVYVGTTLQANAGDWTIDGSPVLSGLSYSYLWSNNLNGNTSTASTYVVQPDDIGADITVTVTAHKSGYLDSDAVVSPASVTPAAHPAPVVTKAPVVTHVSSHGVTTWSVTTGTWNTTGLTYSYAWDLGGSPIGTNSRSITSTTIGTPLPGEPALSVVVSATKIGYLVGNSARMLASKGTTAFTNTGDATIQDVTTGSPVSGGDCLNFGDHLTVAAHGTWSMIGGIAPSSYTYQWYRSTNGGTTWVAVKGATTPNYTITTADSPNLNSTQISVVETPVSAFYAGVGHRTVVGIAMSIDIPTVSPGAILTGAPVAGHTVGVATSGWGISGLTYSYQWVDCPATSSCTDPTDLSQFVDITGATKSTLLLQAADVAVSVTVTASKPGYNSAAVNTEPTLVQNAMTVVNTSVPRISGLVSSKAPVGVKLTALPGAASVTGTTTTYQWQVQECAPGSCTGTWTNADGPSASSTYTPDAADYGSGDWSIRVEQTSHKTGYTSIPSDSAVYPLVLGTLKLVHASSVTTTASTYTFNAATYSPAAGNPTVQWEVDGAPGSTTSTPPFTFGRGSLVAADALVANVTYSVAGYSTITVPVLIQRGVTQVVDPESIVDVHAISGVHLGDELQAGVGAPFDVASGVEPTFTYQWYSNGAAIKGAIKSKFTPSYGYVGRHLTLRVTGTSPWYTTATEVSPAVTLQDGAFGAAALPTVTWSGTLQPGVVATAVPDPVGYGTTGITFHYQWQRSTNGGTTWSSISGATLSHYTPVATDVTDELKVIVTASKTDYPSLTLFSAPVTVQYSPTLATVTPPTISGSGQVNGVLTLSTGLWNTPTLTYTYQWFVDGTAMPGAVSTTFTPVASEVGDDVYVAVTAHRTGWVPVTVPSDSITVANASAPVDLIAPAITFSNTTGVYTVSPGSWNVDGLKYTYQWQVNGTDGVGTDANNVTGSTSTTYKPDASETGSGQILTVIVTVTRIGYANATPLTVTWPNGL